MYEILAPPFGYFKQHREKKKKEKEILVVPACGPPQQPKKN
jgi:hypothetical protein